MAKSKITNGEDFDQLTYSALNVFNPDDGITVLENEHIDSTRWTEVYRLVWREGSESEFDPRQITEVKPIQVVVTKYVSL